MYYYYNCYINSVVRQVRPVIIIKMERSVMLLLSVMTVSGLPSLSSFTDVTLPFPESDDGNRDISPPYMDYDETTDDYFDDYNDYDYDDDNDNSDDDTKERMDGRLRQQIKSCEFIDLTALGPICNTGKKIKYYKVGKHLIIL
jgi:hypothetical protein